MTTSKIKSYEWLCIDFETQDKYIKLGLGSGWVYGNIWVGGCAIKYPDGNSEYLDCSSSVKREKVKRILNKAKTLIVFNANYDIGILKMWKMDIEKFLIIDVMLMAKMHSSIEMSYTLDAMAKKYLKSNKSDAPLADLAKELGLVKTVKQNAAKVAKENMRIIQETNYDLVAKYAIQDVELTYALYEYYKSKNADSYFKFEFHSDLIKSRILMRARGIPIDLVELLKQESSLQIKLMDAQLHLNSFNDGLPVNSSSPKQVANLLRSYGLPVGVSKAGGDGVDKAHLEKVNHPLAKAVLKVRAMRTLKTNFIDAIINIQKYTIKAVNKRGEADKTSFGSQHLIGYIYPELKIYGAAATGRSSCASPNMQNMPAHGELGKELRKIFIAHPGDIGVGACDFSAQEPRLLIHYGAVAGCSGVKDIVQEFITNLLADFHSYAAEVTGLTRKAAKAIGLGLLYGKGLPKLAVDLGVDIEQAKQMRAEFFKHLPFAEELIKKTQESIKNKGFILTLDGRRLSLDRPFKKKDGNVQTFEYKALNKLMQGSAAGQTNICEVELYRRGIPILMQIHDEFFTSLRDEDHLNQIKEVMETAVKLKIPTIADAASGDNWAECK